MVIARRLRFVVPAVVSCLAWMGCQPAVQPPAGDQKVRSKKLDEDFIRVRLLMSVTVQKDLGLTADQLGKFAAIVKIIEEQWREFRAKSQEILPPSQSFPAEEFKTREKEFRALSEDFKHKGKELRTKAFGLLTPSQNARLKQIQLQAAIPAALARPEIIKALDISEEQSRKIRAMCDRMHEKLSAERPDLRNLGSKERRRKMIEFMKKSDQIQAEATKPVLDILTLEQRTKFEELQGKKIEVTWPYDALMPEDAEF
jgi:hypothetical protein